jgi:TRAP-type C4-dicarboxylate transport system permease small subunit
MTVAIRPEPRWLGRLADAAYHGSAIVLLATMVLIAVNALLRYGFHAGSSGIYDIARFSFLIIIFLGLTRTSTLGGHARVRLLLGLMTPRMQHVILHRIVPLLSMLYLAALFLSGAVMTYGFARAGSHTSGVVAIPLAPVTAIIPVATALCLAVQASHLVHFWSWREDRAL